MRYRVLLMSVFGVMLVIAVAGCETTPVQQGALMGGALGAGAGAIIGNQVHGQGGEGALIGAAAGALTGALVGDQVEKSRERAGVVQAPPPPPQPVVVQAPPPQPVVVQAPPPPQITVVQPAPQVTVVQPPPSPGHYENRIVRSPSGETYEERVWVPGR